MRGKGITFDIGFLATGTSTREPFDPEVGRGVVKLLDGQSGAGGRRYPDLPWEPKAAFATLADCYGR